MTLRVLESKPYLERNRDIVDASEVLIACPSTREEVMRSGTWATVRYARKKGMKITLIFRDGTCEKENFGVPGRG